MSGNQRRGDGPRRLGPSQDLLDKADAAKREAEDERRRKLGGRSRNSGPRTAQDKAAAIAAMKKAAEDHEEDRWKRASAASKKSDADEGDDGAVPGGSAKTADFLKAVKSDMLGNLSVEDQVRARRHFQQRNPGEDTFLAR